ncbi:hypothetical protein H5410_022270 [Solanum commersonii]|uniref:Protein kinase domain-containing protein n=1 Tax=Solanum commersonii TaxID=4109 RepID=A0A9J5ZEY9_SOLCO|nr:hypothetical protein H5410_022270 [Solanum commersonii]
MPTIQIKSISKEKEKFKVNTSLDEKDSSRNGESGHIAAHTFTVRELAAATKYFRADCLLGEGGFELSPDKTRPAWNTRMKIAVGATKVLEYLHDKANPPVIYRDLKCSNILLDEDYNPKLSDFGLTKLGLVDDKTHVSTRVMGSYGYCAPEYAMMGQLTLKSDVYSFGVVLLEIITGRSAIDTSRAAGEQNLVAWARPLFKDHRKFSQMTDPELQFKEQPNMRPLMADGSTTLELSQSKGVSTLRTRRDL